MSDNMGLVPMSAELTMFYHDFESSLAFAAQQERDRIIKLLEGYALQKCDDLCAYQCECYGKFEAKGFIELIKGEQK